MKIKTRFAPSPSGYLHIGSIRIALYSWLFARKYNGKFILRIEDTNKSKFNSYYSNEIINDLKWLGLNWDNDIIYQSNRLNRYNEIIKHMLEINKAYYCFCSEKRLEYIKKIQISKKEKPKYDKFCRNLSKDIIYKNIKHKKSFVIRFKNPIYGMTSFNDYIHGEIKFNNNELDDLIIKKSDGNPTYNFCAILDDHDMQITHIIRGDDHISNTPRQINILKSINFKIPCYIHIPIILDIDKKKISKKNDFSNIKQYRKEGLLPHSILHYLSKIDNNSNINKKIFNIEEIIKNFNFKTIKKSPIIFDIKKLLSINKLYISNLDELEIEKQLNIYIKESNFKIINLKTPLIELIKVFKKRCNSFNDLLDKSKYIYQNTLNNNNNIYENINTESILLIKFFYLKIKKLEKWKKENINKIIKKILINKDKILIINFYNLIRRIISGMNETPELYLIIYLIGKKIVTEKISIFIKNI